jgi:hypothetical protein
MEVLPKRFSKFGLELHPDKTELLDFQRPTQSQDAKPATFDFLGFTHYWGAGKKGRLTIRRQTMANRLQQGIAKLWEWCKTHRHLPIKEQHAKISSKLLGHYGYFGYPENRRRLLEFLFRVKVTWKHWLNRRSNQSTMTWERFAKYLQKYPLPEPTYRQYKA